MKLYITVDMEGVTGVTNYQFTAQNGREYERARRLMLGEVNAAIDGALKAGVDEITVCDSHFSNEACNLIAEELREEAMLINGMPRLLGQIQGAEQGYDLAFLLGYHAKGLSMDGVMSHTYHGRVVETLTINNLSLGEVGLNTHLLGEFNIPVTLVTGDDKTVIEAKNLIPEVETVITKWGIGRFAAKSLHPNKARQLITETAEKAVKNASRVKPILFEKPVELIIQLKNEAMADICEMMPLTRRIDAKTISYVAEDALEAYKAFQCIVQLGSSNLGKYGIFYTR